MRSFLTASVVALVLVVPSSARAQASSSAAGQKIAYVNTQLILQGAPGASEAQAAFQKDVEGLQRQVQVLSDSMAALEQAFTREAGTLSPTAREARLKTLTEKKESFEERAEKLNQQAEQRQFELMQPIMDNVRKALDDIRIEGGYSFIFDVANSSMIVAADKNLDLTDRVIAKLRTMPRATAPAAPTGPATRPAGVQSRPTRPPTL
jgi:outer membrane protein